MRLLVTGGAGYIGSHVVRQLSEAGHEVVVYDNLFSGNSWAVLGGKLVVGDLSEPVMLEQLFEEYAFDTVLHFAAHIVVPESVSDPLKYYSNNTRNTLDLLRVCSGHGVKNFVFSSTAAVYGMSDCVPITEDALLAPINPYGNSKMMSERMIMDLAAATDLRYVILRYFNVAGADPCGRIGQATPEATHLIKVATEAALGKRQQVTIFGTDYPTPDATCIRDYIYVEDLAKAHVDAVDYLAGSADSVVLNCGYGHGYSVREVIEMVKHVSGTEFPVHEGDRRPGDPPVLVADNRKIQQVLGWQPRHDDLEFIVRTALEWERRLNIRLGVEQAK